MKNFLKVTTIVCLFAIPFLALYIEDKLAYPYVTGKNFAFRILVEIAVAAWFVLALYDEKYRPRINGIVQSFIAVLIVMFFANAFGVSPHTSFWDNFERMDGYISLIHTFLFMLVLSSTFQNKEIWGWYFDISLAIGFLIAAYGLVESTGIIQSGDQFNQHLKSSRIYSTLGNAAYMSVYMLFLIFIAFWQLLENKEIAKKVAYGSLILFFIYILFKTGTRGTLLGLIVGIFVMSFYLAIFEKQFSQYRKYAFTVIAIMVVTVGTITIIRDSDFIQSNQNLSRLTNISIEALDARLYFWDTSIEGVKKNPLLGYGQSNFTYAFNEFYHPDFYQYKDQRWDRAHSFIFEWLVTGGILGLLAYLSIFVACIWYLFIRPLRNENDNTFSPIERTVVLGLLGAYFIHSLATFDTVISYIYFAVILGFISSRVGSIPPQLSAINLDSKQVTTFVLPPVFLVLILTIYFINIPGITAARELMLTSSESNAQKRLQHYKNAVDANSFAHQQITEKLIVDTIDIMNLKQIPQNIKQEYLNYAEEQILRLLNEKPGDAQVHMFASGYYIAAKQFKQAAEQMALARKFAPNKQIVIIQQGLIAHDLGDNQQASEFFKTAFELAKDNIQARMYYAASLLSLRRNAEAMALIESDEIKDAFANNEYLIYTATRYGQLNFLEQIYQHRIFAPSNAQYQWNTQANNWLNLANMKYRLGKKQEAINILQVAKSRIQGINETADCYILSIENNGLPERDCSNQK